MDSDTAAESDLSLRSLSFLSRVNNRLRKMLNRSPEDPMQDIDKRSLIWCMFMSSTLEASVLHSIKNTKQNLTLKKMFEISEQLMLEQSEEISGVSQINWESSQWKQLSVITDEEVISLSYTKVYIFSDSVLCLGKVNQNPASNSVWKEQLSWFWKIHDNTKHWTQSMENRWNSSGIFSQTSHPCSLLRSSKVHERNGHTRKIPRTNYLHADVQWHHMVKQRQRKGIYC